MPTTAQQIVNLSDEELVRRIQTLFDDVMIHAQADADTFGTLRPRKVTTDDLIFLR